MRPLAALALVALVGALPALAGAEAANLQIIQQRTRDGSILLTDRALPGATTERSWQVRGEDPAAARQRAIDVKAEANLVSERIQRMLDQQRRFDLEAERLRVARLDLERAAPDRDASYGGVVLLAPTRVRGPQHGRFHHDGRPGGRSHGGAPRPGRFRG